ncbi:MAG: hypothetical protein FD174_4289 [Geobacteraceae bacterium]|nr:MAG: hypothetical protein FD174_4289 [Geobacteraceae bacterium]
MRVGSDLLLRGCRRRGAMKIASKLPAVKSPDRFGRGFLLLSFAGEFH